MNIAAKAKSSLNRLLTRRSAWRFVWLLLLVLHAPITYRVFAVALDGESKWSSLLLIAATNLFFVLEITFGWSLKLLTDRRRIITFCVIIALLHVGMVDHALPGWSFMTELNAWLAVSIGGLMLILECLPRLSAFFANWQTLVLQTHLALRRRASHRRTLCTCEAYSARYLKPSMPHRAPPF